jgi:hypothetical protein
MASAGMNFGRLNSMLLQLSTLRSGFSVPFSIIILPMSPHAMCLVLN